MKCQVVWLCQLLSSADNLCKQLWSRSWNLIWIQFVWYSDGLSKILSLKKVSRWQKACKLSQHMTKFHSFQQKQYHQYSDYLYQMFVWFFVSSSSSTVQDFSGAFSHIKLSHFLWDIVQRAPFLFADYASKNKFSFKFLCSWVGSVGIKCIRNTMQTDWQSDCINSWKNISRM